MEQIRKLWEYSSLLHALQTILILLLAKISTYFLTPQNKKKNICWKGSLSIHHCFMRHTQKVVLKFLDWWQRQSELRDKKLLITTIKSNNKRLICKNKKLIWKKQKRLILTFPHMTIILWSIHYGLKWTNFTVIHMNCNLFAAVLIVNLWLQVVKP